MSLPLPFFPSHCYASPEAVRFEFFIYSYYAKANLPNPYKVEHLQNLPFHIADSSTV